MVLLYIWGWVGMYLDLHSLVAIIWIVHLHIVCSE